MRYSNDLKAAGAIEICFSYFQKEGKSGNQTNKLNRCENKTQGIINNTSFF